MPCTTCGRALAASATSCPYCGTPVPSPTSREATGLTGQLPTAQRVALVLAGLLAVLSLGVAGWLVATRDSATSGTPAATPSTSSTPTPTPTRRATPTLDPVQVQQAAAFDALLDRTAGNRDAVGQAVTQLQACTTSAQDALAVFQTAAQGRRDLGAQLGALELSALPEGSALGTQLGQALSDSADADEAFATWAARLVAAGCTPGAPDADLATGLALSSTRARPAKEKFVATWNPVAARFGLSSRSAGEL